MRTAKEQRDKDLQIIQTLIDSAKNKLTSRYTLGLERAYDSINEGSAKKSLQEQESWIRQSLYARKKKAGR